MHLTSTCNINKLFILQPSVTRFSKLLMNSSRIMRNSYPSALAFAQDIDMEEHFRIIIEKYSVSLKIKLKWKNWEVDYFKYIIYDVNATVADPKMFNDLPFVRF